MNQFRRIQAFVANLAKIIKQAPEILYCLLLGIFHLSVLFGNIRFNLSRVPLELVVQILSVSVLVLLDIFISCIFIGLIHRTWAMIPALALVLGFLYLCAGMQRDKFDGLMIFLLAVGAYGKDYRNLLKVLLWCTIGSVAVAMIGIPIGITLETPKVGAYGTGLAFGFAHPNVFGSYVFFIFITIWYLYIRERPLLIEYAVFGLSWLLAVFMVFIPKCRTQALLLLLFPFAVMACKGVLGAEGAKKRTALRLMLRWVMILAPIFCFLITVLLGTQREWLVTHTFGTYIENFSKRFIQAGLAFKEHGFPLFGELIRFTPEATENLGGYTIPLYVLDNGYVTYTILRGMIWMVPALLWLTFADWKISRRNDYRMLAVSVLFCLMGLMERYTFTMYNYIFLYPLAIALDRGNSPELIGRYQERSEELEAKYRHDAYRVCLR